MIKSPNVIKKMITIALLALIAILSITVISDYASSVETHSASIATLDEKKTTAMGLTTAVAVTSTAITAIPGDVATPIATQVSELTTPLLIVICAIYLEKFLLTITGYISFTYLIPIACLCAVLYILLRKEIWKTLSIKLTIFALAIFLIVPASVKITKLVEATFQESINQTIESAQKIEEEAQNTNQEDSNALLDFIGGIGEGITSLVDNAKNALGIFVDAIAVLIITSCIIPVLVMFVFVWAIKYILGANINIPDIKTFIPMKDNKKIGFKKE